MKHLFFLFAALAALAFIPEPFAGVGAAVVVVAWFCSL